MTIKSKQIKSAAELSFAFIVIFLFGVLSANAQYSGELKLEGQALMDGDGMKDAMVTVYHDAYDRGDYWPVDQFMTGRSGKFKLDLKYNSLYIVEVGVLGGHIKTYFIDTQVAPSEVSEDKDFAFEVDFEKIAQLEDLNTTAQIEFSMDNYQFTYVTEDANMNTAGK